MHQKKGKHFSFHIGTHLAVIFMAFAVVLLAGYSAKGSHMNFRALLSEALAAGDISSLSVSEVTFSVVPGSLVKCSIGIPRTSVVFSLSNAAAGGFVLSAGTTGGGTTIAPGEYYLPNGTYHWSAMVKSGYVGGGDLSGDFTLNSTCPLVATTTTEPSTSLLTATTTNPVFDGSILPEVWFGGHRIAPGSTISDSPIIKLYAPGAMHVRFELMGMSLASKIFTEQNGVTRASDSNLWSIDLRDMGISDGIYKVGAFFETSSGKYYTGRFSFNINRVQSMPSAGDIPQSAPSSPLLPATSSSGVMRPILKVFIDNTPITDREHAFSNGEVELRVVASSTKKVLLFAASSSVIELGKAVKDDLLSMSGNDVWSFIWDMEKIPEGKYKVFARVFSSDDQFIETQPVIMSVVHESSGGESSPATTPEEKDNVNNGIATGTQEDTILSRVTTPSLCTNKQECETYCASHPEEKDRCTTFVRTMLPRSVSTTTSLADDIDPARIQAILNDQKRSKEIPEEVSSPEKLKDFCADLSHADVCTKVLVRNDLASEKTLDMKKESLTQIKDEEKRIFVERVGARPFIDSDMDGISDYDEVNIYHTNPNDPDTDHDGFPDGAEILAHTNPLGGESAVDGTTTVVRDEFVKLENPRITGTLSPDLLTVDNVSLLPGDSSQASEATSSSKLSFKGHALPNSFVTLYIFSDPIVVTVKADESGTWTYTLNKELGDGSHQIYSAITDSGGHILAKSEPLPFVKTASAVSVGSAALLPTDTEPGFFSGASLYAFVAIIIGVLGIAFSIIGFMVRRRDIGNIPFDPTA